MAQTKRKGLAVKSFTPPRHLKSQKQRNSNVEILRIIAMYLIIWTHLGPGDAISSLDYPILAKLLSYGGGSIGDVLFFSISAWYLCVGTTPDLRSTLSRIWKLEKQLLFYSLGMFLICSAVYLFTDYPMLQSLFDWVHLGVVSVAPTLFGLWWYPTAYIIFLLFLPLLNVGLKTIGQQFHGVLAVALLAVFGTIPYFSNNMSLGILLFIYQYVLISYVRWYLPQIERSMRWAWGLFLGGMLLVIASFAVQELIPSFGYGSEPWKIPSLAAAFGLLLIANQAKPHHWRAINTIATSTLPVYLVHLYWPVTMWLQFVMGTVFRLTNPANPWITFMIHAVMLALIFAAVVIIDLIRRKIFSLLDRHDPIQRKLAAQR